jgi:signal transduction histidine kinase
MLALAAVSIALAVAWALTAVVVMHFGERGAARRLAAACGLLAAAHGAAAAQAAVAPLVLGAWLLYALVVPTGRLGSAQRRALAAGFGAAVLGWTCVLLAQGSDAARPVFVVCAIIVTVSGAVAAVARYPKASGEDRRVLRWLAAASVLAAAFTTVCLTLDLMIGAPQPVDAWLAAALLLIPLGQVLAVFVPGARAAAIALVESIAAAGVAALGAGVYLVVVVGIQGAPHGRERDVLLASLAAALVVAALAVPVRHRLVGFAGAWIGATEPSSDQVITSFGARMSRAVPMDELMLQLVESLRVTVAAGGAEIWAGADGVLVRTVSVPSRPPARLVLGEEQRAVVGRARVGGSSWASVWLPDLPDTGVPANGARADVRVVPVAHLGELLGLIVVRGAPGTAAFTDADERLLVDLARQLGLALHNVRLDSALQASLAELEQRNAELQASRLRIVSASDQARRSIERNLHDGAQQHLVALAVKLSLARQIVDDGNTASVPGLLDELRADVQATIAELRELAHGIYPPLLRDRGLGEALRAAAARSPLACSVDVDLPARYPEEAEAAAYFCCLEALQNAGKHAGATAEVTVRVGGDGTVLWFEVADDGVGFDSARARSGHGFLNMRDRLGAIGGRLSVESTPGHGTRVSARIPAHPLRVAAKRDDAVLP